MGGVDALTGTYRLACPDAGSTARVRLSSFREIERLPGPAHPAVYRVSFSCGCGGEHVGLVGHDALDWAPLGLDDDLTYVNLMTSRHDDLAAELTGLASARIGRGSGHGASSATARPHHARSRRPRSGCSSRAPRRSQWRCAAPSATPCRSTW